jgi:hypothetical protein
VPRSSTPRVLTDDKVLDISDGTMQCSTKSFCKLSQQAGVSHSSTQKVLKKHCICTCTRYNHCMNWKNVTTCGVCNAAYGLKSSSPLLEKIFWMSHFLRDEVWFHLFGYVHSQNSCVWLTFNLHDFMQVPLHDQKVGVWCTTSWSWVIGPIFFEDNINSDHYYHLILYPFIDHLNDDTSGCFQQGSPTVPMAHVSMRFCVMRLVNR